MTDDSLGPFVPYDPTGGTSPYVLVTVLADHDEPLRASEMLRASVPAHDPPEGWLWFYVRPQRRGRFQVAVLMQRRPEGAQPLLDLLEALGCGELTGQEMARDEPVLPPRTPMRDLLARWACMRLGR